MPDFQNEIATTGILQQADRRVGIDLDDLGCIGLAADIDEHVDRRDAKSDCARRLPRQDDGRFGWRIRQHHCASRTQIHAPGNLAPFVLRRYGVQGRIAIRQRSG